METQGLEVTLAAEKAARAADEVLLRAMQLEIPVGTGITTQIPGLGTKHGEVRELCEIGEVQVDVGGTIIGFP